MQTEDGGEMHTAAAPTDAENEKRFMGMEDP